MEGDDFRDRALGPEQLKKYAEDLVALYQSEREKRKELRGANEQLKKFAEDLKKTFLNLKSAHKELRLAYIDTIYRLVLAAEYKDEDTGDHVVRMSQYCVLMAEKYGLPPNEIENIRYAAPMHDVGKIGIPDSILMKPGRLTEEEFETMKTHTTIGARILAGSRSEILQLGEQIARSHHERWDGNGYPDGIAGEEIPLVARIVALADVFDALTSRRPYKEPYPVETALSIIREGRGTQFDPRLVDLFLKNINDVISIKEKVAAGEELFPIGLPSHLDESPENNHA